jgi:hypothetical protein
MIGKTLGHYQRTNLLGKGGIGEVHRADDLNPDREVALKSLHRALKPANTMVTGGDWAQVPGYSQSNRRLGKEA